MNKLNEILKEYDECVLEIMGNYSEIQMEYFKIIMEIGYPKTEEDLFALKLAVSGYDDVTAKKNELLSCARRYINEMEEYKNRK